MSETALSPSIACQQIHDCILRYCSGVDRFDREMLLSVYHPDAIDDHGAFVGGAAEFVEWALAYHAKHPHKHFVLNHCCELDGDTLCIRRRRQRMQPLGCRRATSPTLPTLARLSSLASRKRCRSSLGAPMPE